MTRASLDVKERDVIIVDDIISTGGTIRAAAEKLRRAGAGKIVVACIHPLLIGDAYERVIGLGRGRDNRNEHGPEQGQQG